MTDLQYTMLMDKLAELNDNLIGLCVTFAICMVGILCLLAFSVFNDHIKNDKGE